MTTAKPPAGGSSGAGSGGGSGAGSGGGSGGGSGQTGGASGAGKHSKRPETTRVVLRKLSAKRLGGELKATDKACRAARTVLLWRGLRHVGSARTNAAGRYSFTLSRSLRGRAVRASVRSMSTKRVACAAGSSIFLRA